MTHHKHGPHSRYSVSHYHRDLARGDLSHHAAVLKQQGNEASMCRRKFLKAYLHAKMIGAIFRESTAIWPAFFFFFFIATHPAVEKVNVRVYSAAIKHRRAWLLTVGQGGEVESGAARQRTRVFQTQINQMVFFL